MSTTAIERDDIPSPFDAATCFRVASRSRPHDTHQIELTDYDANGTCSCEAFTFNYLPLLSRGYTPSRAIMEGLATLKRKGKPDKHPDDALRCEHIIESYRQIGPICVRAISNAKKLTHQKKYPDPPPF